MSEDQRTEYEYKPLTEDARRYYLDAMGVQCWESLDVTNSEIDIAIAEDVTNFQSLERKVQQCEKCQLHKTRNQATAGQGNPSADLMFVLLSPDESGEESATFCNREALNLFGKMLAAINISIDDVYITSLLKCTVPDFHTVSMAEVLHCNYYLKQQVQIVQPKLVVILGDTAARCMLQKNITLDELRDEINQNSSDSSHLFESVPLFISYSPHELLQNADNKRKAWSDLQQIQSLIEG